MAYDFDYDYSSDILDDIIDDSINTAYTPPPAADYGAVGDAVGGVFSDAASGIVNLIAPSILASQGYNVDGSSALPTLEQLLASGGLSASNIAGVPDSFVLPTEERNLMTEGDFIFPAVSEDIFLDELYNYDPNDAFIANVGVGPGSGYDPRNVGTGGTPTEGTPTGGDPTSFPEDADPRNRGFMSSLLSALGLGGIMQGGIGGAFGNILGSMIGGKGSGSPLIDYLMMKSLLKDEPKGFVPVGGQAYGGQAFSSEDYRPINLQPALMPGVAYANMAAPAMMVGGEAKQYPNEGLAALAKEAPEVVERMGYEHGGSIENRPGDITFAKLEPGEFVIQKPAVDAIGIETLRKINSMGDGRPYYG
tara:strand:+ start:1112 stop:2200 length:1089 start_codon:yes stop_codon:yes gene_type:complete